MGPIANAVRSILTDIREFGINAEVSGPLENYKVSLSSDLDDHLKKGVGRMVKEQTAQLEKTLRKAVNDKVNSRLGDLKGQLGGFGNIEKDLYKKLNIGNDLLKIKPSGKGKKGGGLNLPFKLPF